LKEGDGALRNHDKNIFVDFLFAWEEILKYLNNNHKDDGGKLIETFLLAGISWELLICVGVAIQKSGFVVKVRDWKILQE
jgi:hypothetical protein